MNMKTILNVSLILSFFYSGLINAGSSHFDPATGILYISDVEVPGTFGGVDHYEVQMDITSSSNLTFAVTSATLIDVASDPCVQTIGINDQISGEWIASCTSTGAPGSYAKYYTLTVSNNRTVVIDLTSNSDTILVLYQGDKNGSIIASNDDADSLTLNSQINIDLAPGTYTIEATTFDPSTLDIFTLSVR